METLAARIARKGALRDTDAVGWVIRLAKGIERIHALGGYYGHITSRCMQIEGDACTSGGHLVDPRQAPYLVSYHSPERVAGLGSSQPDDAWALAVLLYEALTATLPFVGTSEAEIRQSIEAAAPAPLAAFDVGDEALQRILDRAFAREPSERSVEVAELRGALEAWPPMVRFNKVLLPLSEPPGEADAEEDEDAVTRIRGDIAPLLQDLIQAASVSPTTPPESARGAAAPRPQTRPPEASAASSALGPVRLASGRRPTLTGLTSLGLGGQALPGAGTVPPPSRVKPSVPPAAHSAEHDAPSPAAPAAAAAAAPEHSLFALPPSSKPAPTSSRGAPPSSSRAASPISSREVPTPSSSRTASPTSSREAPPPSSSKVAPPAPAQDLPGLVDEDSSDDPDDVFTIPGTWRMLDVVPPSGSASADPSPEPPGAARDARGESDEQEAPAAPAPREPPTPAPEQELPAQPRPAFATRPSLASPPGRRWVAAVVFIAAALVGGGLTAWLWTGTPAQPEGAPATSQVPTAGNAPAPSAVPSGAAATSSATPAASAEAAASAALTASADADSSAEAAPAPPASATASAAVEGAPAVEGVDACMVPLFAKGTFESRSRPNFSFLCKETDPRRGSRLIRKQVVLGATSGFVSDGMREWALLGWYELAAYTVMRARCCPDAAPIQLPETPGACPAIAQALNDLGAAATKATRLEDEAIELTLKHFREAINCRVRSGGTNLFGYVGAPKGGEDTAFQKTLVRLLAKR